MAKKPDAKKAAKKKAQQPTIQMHQDAVTKIFYPSMQRMDAGIVVARAKAKEYEVRLREPHAAQDRVRKSKAKRKVVRAGRRGGKTTGIAIIAVELFMRGHRVLYATPTADQIQRFWIEVKEALAEPIGAGVLEVNETLHTIGLPGEISIEGITSKARTQRIRAKTAWNADTLRGDFADDLILDEFQLMNEDTWAVVGAPMVIDNNGDAIFVYTPPSLHSKSVTKATDKRHASKMFEAAKKHEMQCRKEGRQPDWETFHWTSKDNPFLSPEGLEMVAKDMSELAYKQEILAEDLDEAPGALWKRATIAKLRVAQAPDLIRVGIGVDPPGGSTECGIVAAGTAMCNCKGQAEIHGFVLEDASTEAGQGPEIWAATACDLYKKKKADFMAVEKNYGGDMVAHTISTEDKTVMVKEVQATRGKAVRAEPVSNLYEKGMIHHVGKHEQLEDEQCQWVPGMSGHSPNRMDAAVWVLTDLMVQPDYTPLSEGSYYGELIPREFQPLTWPQEM